jgi:hypothetical protein
LEAYNGNRELAGKHSFRAYLAYVAFVDEQVGKVVDVLNESELETILSSSLQVTMLGKWVKRIVYLKIGLGKKIQEST